MGLMSNKQNVNAAMYSTPNMNIPGEICCQVKGAKKLTNLKKNELTASTTMAESTFARPSNPIIRLDKQM